MAFNTTRLVKFVTPNPCSHLESPGHWKSWEPVCGGHLRGRHHEDTQPQPGAVPLPVASTSHVLLVVERVDLLEVYDKHEMFGTILAKLPYFTNLDFPEIRGFPFFCYLLG